MSITFDDLDIDLGDGLFIKAYEVDPDVRLDDSSFTAQSGHGDVVVPRADPVLYGMEVTAMHWGDAEGNEYHCWPEDASVSWPEDASVPPVGYFQACYAHALENEERILDHWTCDNA